MSTKPARLDLSIYKGATLFRRFTWTDRRTPIDITGFTFEMQIRPTVESSVIIAELSTTNGSIVIEDAAQGIFSIELPAVDTEAITETSGVYDIEVTDASGRVSRILYGDVKIVPGVTR